MKRTEGREKRLTIDEDEGRGTRDGGRGTRDEGRGTRDEGRDEEGREERWRNGGSIRKERGVDEHKEGMSRAGADRRGMRKRKRKGIEKDR